MREIPEPRLTGRESRRSRENATAGTKHKPNDRIHVYAYVPARTPGRKGALRNSDVKSQLKCGKDGEFVFLLHDRTLSYPGSV